MLAVGPDGTIDIAYRTRQENPSSDASTYSREVDTFYQQSTDGGQHFTRPLRVNAVTGDTGFAANCNLSDPTAACIWLEDFSEMAAAGTGPGEAAHDGAGGVLYIARAEAVTGPGIPQIPPLYHHQAIWVATVPAPVSTRS
jgi:hypothetical protein